MTAKRIYATPQARRELAKQFRCTHAMVSYALTYTRNSDLARKIRQAAITQYQAAPSWSAAPTTHHTPHRIIQQYAPTVRLTLDLRQRTLTLENDGITLTRVDNPTPEKLIHLQEKAQQLSSQKQ